MRIKHTILYLLVASLLSVTDSVAAQSIAEKKEAVSTSGSDLDRDTDQLLAQVNQRAQEVHGELQQLYQDVWSLYQQNAYPEQYQGLLERINACKQCLTQLEKEWHDRAVSANKSEGYGLWHAPETTLEQLIIDYGSQDYVYLIPPEVASIKLSVNSNLPIPRAGWNAMLEHIFTQNGVGVKTLNPYLKQLYLIKQNFSGLKAITNQRKDLEVLPCDTRISFVLSPEPSEVRRVYLFLEKFINPNSTVLQILGRDILLIGQVSDIQDLLKLYDFVGCNRGDKEYRLIAVHKTKALEMARIVGAMFDHHPIEGRSPSPSPSPSPTVGPPSKDLHNNPLADANGLRIIVLENMAQALFVMGTREEVRKAEEIVRTVEEQIGGARDKTVFWYTAKHSDAEELADVLSRVYALMVATSANFDGPRGFPPPPGGDPVIVEQNNNAGGPPMPPPPVTVPPVDPTYQGPGYVVNPAPAQPGIILPTAPNRDRQNFIVDMKTGAIVMVVETDLLPKLKDLIRRLDVPKKMVQIETMLFEKVLKRENSIGINLLRIGDLASNCNFTGAIFANIIPAAKEVCPHALGVFEFLISRKKTDSGIPAFDLAYRFLLAQDDVQINSCPSVLAINQTTATIAITEDISINTGVYQVDTPGGAALKDAFTRAQYGITISIKPTIHISDPEVCDEDEDDYVTLETDVTFDTFQPGGERDRPIVTRRHITNHVQVPDGESVILGNLRRKILHDSNNSSLPFLSEIPGIGKLFGYNSSNDLSSEMFIFITPRIVKDPKTQLAEIRRELLCRRPGDIPYFLECVEEAHLYEKSRLFANNRAVLFGRPRDRYYIPDCSPECVIEGEYDGR